MSNQNTNWQTMFSNWIAGTFPTEEVASSSLDLQSLEDRVLYSAGPLPVDVSGQVEYVDANVEMSEFANEVDAQFDFIEQAIEAYDFEDLNEAFADDALAVDDLALSNIQNPELVIVDRSVDGYEQLVEDLLSSKSADRNFEVVYLVNESNGVKQITSILEGLSLIHI